MEKTTLTAQKRTIVGKKAKKLRKDGLVLANLFGKTIKSLSLQLPVKEFMTVYKKVGETGLVELKVDKETFHTLITKLQTDPVSRLPLHAEFHAVSLTEKIKVKVPVELIGESQAVKDGVGLLLQTLSEVEVEALPTDLPEKIEINVENLTAVDQQIMVADIKEIKGVEILTGKEEIIVKVVPAVSQEAQEEAKKEAEEKAAQEVASSDQAPAPAEGSQETPADQKDANAKEPAE